MKEYSLILLSGGVGKRMQLNYPKQFLLLAGKPIFIHVLEKVDRLPEIKEIIITCPHDYMDLTEETITPYGFHTPIRLIEGGETRQESVYKGLLAAQYDDVIIHEAVRPFVTVEMFQRLINEPVENAIFGLEIPFTVLKGRDKVEGNLKREELINVQLPHKFSKDRLLYAHECAREENLQFTEDASLHFHYYKSDITVLKGSDHNIKITTPVDRKIAEAIYKETVLMTD